MVDRDELAQPGLHAQLDGPEEPTDHTDPDCDPTVRLGIAARRGLSRYLIHSCASYPDSLEATCDQRLQRKPVVGLHDDSDVAHSLDVDSHEVDDVLLLIGAFARYDVRRDAFALGAPYDETFDDFTTFTGRVDALFGLAICDELGLLLDAPRGDEQVVQANYRYK